jgi:hypothetical protein
MHDVNLRFTQVVTNVRRWPDRGMSKVRHESDSGIAGNAHYDKQGDFPVLTRAIPEPRHRDLQDKSTTLNAKAS